MSAIANILMGQMIKKKMDEDKQSQAMGGLQNQLDYMNKIAGEVETAPGILSKPMGAFQNIKQYIGLNPELDELEGLTGALTGQIARKIAGEKGQLTDKDIKRAGGLMPTPWDSTEARARKASAIKVLIEALGKQQQGGGLDTTGIFGVE